jgi:hypothetical protein
MSLSFKLRPLSCTVVLNRCATINWCAVETFQVCRQLSAHEKTWKTTIALFWLNFCAEEHFYSPKCAIARKGCETLL